MIAYPRSAKCVAVVMLVGIAFGRRAAASVPAGSPAYYLACIQINEQDRRRLAYEDNRVQIYALDSKGEPLTLPVEILNTSATRITPDGRIVSGLRFKGYSQFGSTENITRDRAESLWRGNAKINLTEEFKRIGTASEASAWDSVLAYLHEHHMFDPAVHREAVRSSLNFEMYEADTAVSPLDRRIVIKAGIYDKDTRPHGEYAPNWDALFLVDFATSTVQHIAGTDQDRYFVHLAGDTLVDGKVTFYRIRNFLSIMMSNMEDNPAIIPEGGWEVCCYDIATRKLEVLAKSPYRYGPYPGSLLWSPDRAKLLYTAAHEPFQLDKVNNECPGKYVYDVTARTSFRPTDKHQQERAICWAPDSRRFLIWCRPNPFHPDGTGPRGYYVVDLNGGLYPLLPFDKNEVTEKGLHDFRDTFRWSPDGKFIAFCARFKQGDSEYDGIFMMPDDRSGRYWLIDKAKIQPKVAGKAWVFDYFFNLVWLE